MGGGLMTEVALRRFCLVEWVNMVVVTNIW